MAVHQEVAFETAIEADMLASGWASGLASDYDRELGLDSKTLIDFLRQSQPVEWELLTKTYGPSTEKKVTSRIASEIDARGTLDVLRKGVKDSGVRLSLAYFEPPTNVNHELVARYAANIFTLTRQLAYEKHGGKELDIVLFVNGLPTATVELKNPLTGQSVEHAKRQYRTDRDPKEILFQRRAIAHFAVDPFLSFVTTHLVGGATRFLPFNQGSRGPGVDGGKGNPTNPGGYDTDFLWKKTWNPNSWMDLLQKFAHRSGPRGKGSLIFPRFHQWHAVHAIAEDVATNGAGKNYLVQHSAGSGKSNTIAWLAHRLSKQHTALDSTALLGDAQALGSGKKVFDKVLVITDRVVLDRQLQDTIFQFEHVPGVVQKIDSDSQQLADALVGSTAQVIITTLQKFPFVVDKIGALGNRRYAVIIDEAHSSASGEGQTKLKQVLTIGGNADQALQSAEEIDHQNEVNADMQRELLLSAATRGKHANLSFFAFTATPKAKTLDIFGTPQEAEDGSLVNSPFHVYSMRQAIEEGFILDVLANYVTYSTFYRLNKEASETGDVEQRKATAALAKYASLHPTNVSQRAEIIVEHFVSQVRGRLGGRAKAMVVLRSRLHALRMQQAIESYIADKNYSLKSLVAFSGTLIDESVTYSEATINGIAEGRLPQAFSYTSADNPANSGKRSEYSLLVVADKYQTGFDEPLLTAMYVDKKLAGVAAVQTLSRLNRTHPLKTQDDVFVLDFANDAEAIQDAFKPFFTVTLGQPSDPNHLYALQTQIMGYQILSDAEMDQYVAVFLAASGDDQNGAQAKLYPLLAPARERFTALMESDSAAADAFVKLLRQYERQYAYLAQIIAYVDVELERLYLFGKFLLRLISLLRAGQPSSPVDLGNVSMTHFRLTHSGDHVLSLGPDEGAGILSALAGDGTGPEHQPPLKTWDIIIAEFNERFGTEWTSSDLIRALVEHEMHESNVRELALNNTPDNFELAYGDRGPSLAIEKHSDNEQFIGHIFKSKESKNAFARIFARGLYRAIRENGQTG